jgi:putative ABC transport system permease protein
MRVLSRLRARVRALVHRDVVAGEIREELEFHVRMRTEEYEHGGEAHDAAARHARERLGNMAVIQDRGYDVRGGGTVETILQDVRYAGRLLWKRPGFSLVAVLTLALGVGLSTALFSVIDAAMLHPLPYPHPEQLVEVLVEVPQRNGRISENDPSFDDAQAMAASKGVFSQLAVWRGIFRPPIADGTSPERLEGYEISQDYLAMYGVAPAIGRGICEADTRVGAPPVILLGYNYWQSRFGGKIDVLGETLRFNDGQATIVGVLPATFHRGTPIWRPLETPPYPSLRGNGTSTYGRLRPGMSVDQAQRALTEVLAHVPGARPGLRVTLHSLAANASAGAQTTVGILAGAVGLILLIACVNVAGLLLASGATRLPELAIRASIGAGRMRLVRQLLTESLVLSLLGGLVGIVLSWWSLDALVANIPITMSSEAPATINVRVLVFSVALSLVTSVLFGLAPAIRLSRGGVARGLARGERRTGTPLSTRGGQVLIAAEVALAVILLTGAGLMIRSFERALAVDLGFKPDAIVTMEAVPVDTSAASLGQYYPMLLARVRGLPGVAAAGAIDDLPLMGNSTHTTATADNSVSAGIQVRQMLPDYFEAMGLPLRQGRWPTEADRTSGRPVMVINREAAKQLFADASPLGHTVKILKRAAEVIGVIDDIRFNGPLRPSAAEAYQVFNPIEDERPRALVVVVRPSHDARGLPGQLRQAAQNVGPRVLVERVRNGEAWLDDSLVTPKRRTVLLGLLGGLGLLLAVVGVFGMTAYAVARRTREIGLRMAFGAEPGDVVWTMVKDATFPVGLGIVGGLGGAALATRTISSFLFRTTPTDASTFAGVAVTLGVAACLAAWIPARRAAHVDPVKALRAD